MAEQKYLPGRLRLTADWDNRPIAATRPMWEMKVPAGL
tara:strand:+ start:315 stop:428 length:114 start_codon:yes stop_codon:yes gene_type:complete